MGGMGHCMRMTNVNQSRKLLSSTFFGGRDMPCRPRGRSWVVNDQLLFRSAALVLLFLLSAGAAAGQAARRSARIPVRVVLLDALPVSGAGAVIQRRVSGSPTDIILLTAETATARQLSAAVLTLITLHGVDGSTPSRDALVKVNSRQGPTAWIETEERRAEAMVRRLRRLRPTHVQGYGQVRTLVFTVPAKAMDGRLRPVK